VKKRKILFTKDAEADLAGAHDWYRAIDPALGVRLLSDLRLAAERIGAHPLSYPLFLGTMRRMHMQVFPYFVYYRLERGSIVIHAILHTRRRPGLHRERAR